MNRRRRFLLLNGGAAPAVPWYLAGGIAEANLLEQVENPTAGKLYAGASVASGQPWSVVARSISILPTSGAHFLFDSQTGRIVIGNIDAGNYGYFAGAFANVAIFPDTADHVYFLISTGSSIQAYLDGAAIGTASVSAAGLGGTTRWRSGYTDAGANVWDNDVSRGAVYNIALSLAQRTALYTAMASP